MMRSPSITPGPLSRRFDAAAARSGGTPVHVESTQAEREALTGDCGLAGIDAFDAELRVSPEDADRLRVTGRVRARVRQICVVSLDEFGSEVDEPVDVCFAPQAQVEALAAARAAKYPGGDDEEADDLPDPIVGGRIDLGALAAEIMVLGLDPYPRKPGVAFAEPAPPDPQGLSASPFAALRDLKGSGSA